MLRTKVLSLRSAEFELNLLLPRTTFRPGEKIPFEVQIQNPHGVLLEFLTVNMIQTTIAFDTKKRRFSRSNSSKVRIETGKVTSESSGHGFHDTSWFGCLSVPAFLPPTVLPCDPPYMGVIENRYSLQIVATQCENYPLKSEEYPIRIDYYPNNTLRPTTGQRILHLSGQNPIESIVTPSRSPMRRGTSLLAPPSPSLSLFGPPRYSSLSLDSISLESERSFETLPPNYGDLIPTTTTSYLR